MSVNTLPPVQIKHTPKVLDGAGSRPTCLSEGVRRYDKTFFPFYKSHTQSETSVDEAKAS